MENEQEAIRESSRALTQFFVNDGTLGDTLHRVSEMACSITPATYAGITLMVEGAPRTGVFTNPDALEIDEAQYRSGEGPCMYAFRNQQLYRIDDTASDSRWPDFAAAALSHGIHATLSVPLAARGAGIGALNLYAAESRRLQRRPREGCPGLRRAGLHRSGQRPGLLGRPGAEREPECGHQNQGSDQPGGGHLAGRGRAYSGRGLPDVGECLPAGEPQGT